LISSLTRKRLVTLPTTDAQDQLGELIAEWVQISDAVASLSTVADVDSTYGSVVGNYFTPDAVITVQGVTGVDSVYNGVAGALNYLEDLSQTRNVTSTTLGDLQYTWNADGSVTVSAPYTGYEVIFPSGEADSFYGIRVFTAVNQNQGWAFSGLTRTRIATVPAVDPESDISQFLASWVQISDAVASFSTVASVDNTYGSVVGDYFTSNAVITVQGVSGVSSVYNGVSGALSYLENLSQTRNVTNTVLSDMVMTANDDGSYTATCPYVGYEVVWPGLGSNIFFGIRTFVVVAGNPGWLMSSLTRVRSATIPVNPSK